MFFGVMFILATFCLLATFVVYAYRKNQARLAALAQLCAARGWQYYPQDPFGLPDRWKGSPFGQGFDRRAESVITGTVGSHPMVAFEYSYKTESRDSEGRTSTTTHTYAVVALGMPCALPEVQIGPEGLLARVGKAMGLRDVELESEEFNRRYLVRCGDPKLATDVLPPRTMEMLLAYGKITMRLAGSDALAYDTGCLDPVALDRTVQALAAFVDGVPSFVWRDYGLSDMPPPVTPAPGNLT